MIKGWKMIVPFLYKLVGIDTDIYFDVFNTRLLNSEFKDITNNLVVKNKLTLDVYGYRVTRDMDWWRCYAVYNTELPTTIRNKIQELYFVKSKDPKNRSPIMTFIPLFKNNPVMIINNVACKISAMYPWYGCTEDGYVYNIKSGKFLSFSRGGNNSEYKYDFTKIYTKILTPSIISVSIHRMIAFAWCKNDDWENKNIVDHIDENKSNNHSSNLRWVTSSENISKAFNVRSNEKSAIARNIDTGYVKEFDRLKEAFEYIGRSYPTLSNTPLKQGRIWIGTKGRYEIYIKEDFYKWEYEFKLPEENSKLKSEKIYKINAKNIHTGEIKTFNSYKECSDFLGYDRQRIRRRLKYFGVDKLMPLKGWLLKFEYQKWPSIKQNKFNTVANEAKRIQVIDSTTGSVKVYNSKKEFCRKIGSTVHNINIAINNNKPLYCKGNWFMIKEL